MKSKRFKNILLLILNLCFVLNLEAQCNSGGNQNGTLGGGGLDSVLNGTKNLADWLIELILSGDPNQITGNKGYTEKQWVSVHDQLGYNIEFENDPKIATGAAQNVYIHFSVPDISHLNINSLRIGNFGFGNFNFQVPPNSSTYTNRLDLRDSLNLYVDVTAGIDIINHQFFWTFKSIDPLTGTTPTDGRGFLAVSDSSITGVADTSTKGKGFVSFYVNPQSYLKTGDTIAAQASIVFDINDPVPTNVWVNTVDAVAPTSHVDKADTSQNIITLHWSGKDDQGGSGLRYYDLYVSDSGKTFTLYKANIDTTSTTFIGTPGDNYGFFTLATDTTGNKEQLKTKAEITVKLNETILPLRWLYFSGNQQGNDVLLNWATTSEINTKDFVVERSFDAHEFTGIGIVNAAGNSLLVNNYQYLDKDAMFQKTRILYYRLKQYDNDGKFIYSSVVAIPVTNAEQVPIVKAYPNPFNQKFTLQIITISQTDKTDWVRLTSIDGKLVYNRKLNYTGNSTILLQDLPQLSNGIYILNVSVNGKMYKVKMVKQE